MVFVFSSKFVPMVVLRRDLNLKMLCCTSLILHLLGGITLVEGTTLIGVCYGPSGDKFSSPAEVVSIFNTYNITRIRLYEPNHFLQRALVGSEIRVIIGVKNEDIPNLARSINATKIWIETNISPYWPSVRFRYIAVGNEAIPGQYTPFVLQAMYNLKLSLGRYLGHHVKITTVVATSSIMALSSPPSHATFHEKLKQYMIPLVRYLNRTNAPLMANIHPYFTYIQNPLKLKIGYVIFNPRYKFTLRDNNFVYKSLFDEVVDALYVSLRKIGGWNVRIVVSETGWPWKGNTIAAATELAERYNNHIVERASKIDGTPRRRGRVESYLFAMFDEEKKMGSDVEINWGLFDLKKKDLVYNISFTM